MKIFGTALSLFLLAVCLLTTAPAQTTFGTITGTVTDATGAVLPGAPVTLTNEETASSGAPPRPPMESIRSSTCNPAPTS